MHFTNGVSTVRRIDSKWPMGYKKDKDSLAGKTTVILGALRLISLTVFKMKKISK